MNKRRFMKEIGSTGFDDRRQEFERLIGVAQARERQGVPNCRVYFIQESSSGAIKIGYTKSLGIRSRLDMIASCNPYDVKLIGSMFGGPLTEENVHYLFSHAHIKGEWFRPVPELIEYIARLPDMKKIEMDLAGESLARTRGKQEEMDT